MPERSTSVAPGALLDRFRQGDLDAFEALLRQNQRAVYGWIFKIVRDPATAEDLTVETFWRIHRAHARFDPARAFEPWARRIATHAALELSFAPVAPTRNQPGTTSQTFPHQPKPIPASPPRIRIQNTPQALSRTPVPACIAAVLSLVEEQPHKEVAEALGISVTAVKLRIFRAIRLLRKGF